MPKGLHLDSGEWKDGFILDNRQIETDIAYPSLRLERLKHLEFEVKS